MLRFPKSLFATFAFATLLSTPALATDDGVVGALGLRFSRSGAKCEEQRQEMLVGRVRAHAVRRARAVIDQAFHVVLVQFFENPGLELARIGSGLT